MGWANRITLLRLILVGIVWILILVASGTAGQGLWWIAFVIYVVAAITDLVDGAIARRLGQVSVLGRVMDPLADKLLTLGTMVMLLDVPGMHTLIPAWMVVLMLSRELLVTSLRSVVESAGGNFEAISIGKYKAVLQIIATGAGLTRQLDLFAWAYEPLLDLPHLGQPWTFAALLVWAAVLITVYSGVVYTQRAWQVIRTP
jgi:CDP-diacylglycerol--glycerol-3-phosphate 3-phosphatidyltransferase